MVVLQPITPGRERTRLFLKRGGPVRRALLLGPINRSKHNVELAESLLTISAEEFTKKWNFDPIREVPVTGGSYQWQRVTSPGLVSAMVDPATHPRVPSGILASKRSLYSCGSCTSPRSADESQGDAGTPRDVPASGEDKSTPSNTAASLTQCDNSFAACGGDVFTSNNETFTSENATAAPNNPKCVVTNDTSSLNASHKTDCDAQAPRETLRQTYITDFVRPNKRRRLVDLHKNAALHPPITTFV